MKKIQPVFIALALLVCIDPSAAQDPARADTVKNAPGLARGLGIYVFPSGNQDQKTQDADEMACYRWQLRAEAQLLGDRTAGLFSLNYRFGIKGKNWFSN